MEQKHNTQQLERAFAAFSEHSRQLEAAFDSLRQRVSTLTEALADANSHRRQELRAKEALADRLERLLGALPGGVLVRNDAGETLGAVGITGDTSENDEACAVAGIETAGLVADCG